MNEKEMQGLIQNALLKTLKEFEENPDNVFNNLELQEKYNGVLKDKIQLKQENQELKKQLKELEESSANAINKQVARGIELVNQQKEFIEWLESMLVSELDVFTEVKICDVLSKYKEIIGKDIDVSTKEAKNDN